MIKHILFFICTLLAAFTFTKTYSQFTLSGEIRPRFEYRHGYKSLADSAQEHAAFVDQRTRLNFGYKQAGYEFSVVLQDVRTWGSQKQLVTADGLTSLHEAWAAAVLGENFKLKFGRQEIILDDHRIFGNVGWTQQARSHDAAVLLLDKGKTKGHLGIAYNQDASGLIGTSASNGSYKALQYLWFHNDLTEALGASVLFLNNGKQANVTDTLGTVVSTKDNYSQTFGTRISYKKDKLEAHAVYYGQAGVEGDAANTQIKAYLLGFDVAYKLTEDVSAAIGLERQSGNSQTDTSKSYMEVNHAFNPFYGTNHKFNGHMDYFYVGNHIGSVGLQDIFIKLNYAPDKYSIGLDVHMFSAAADVLDFTELMKSGNIKAMGPGLGTELDLTCGFALSEGVALKAGYSQMLGSETLAVLQGVVNFKGEGYTDESSNWAWLMLVVKPVFIKQ